ncbi:MAG: hypothetical protein VX949_00390 [Planctomycetota bacterium]|nr:hypothetical protein [Planctomycetota bacterium]
MILEDRERELLITRTSRRQPALPARRGAWMRGLVVAVAIWMLLFPLVPHGPEMVGSCEVLVEASPFDMRIPPALSVCRTLTATAFGLYSPMMAAPLLSILFTGLACAVCLIWSRQQDAARPVVIPAILMLGLSQGITDIARTGGSAPLSMLLGISLIAATEQMRAEAGRGILWWGMVLGMTVACGPVAIPALIYSLLSLLCDRGLRGVHLRVLPAAFAGVLLGMSLIMLLALPADIHGFRGVIDGFLASWTPVDDPDFSRLGWHLAGTIEGSGILLAALAIPGIIIASMRRPGDLALILTLASSGPLLRPLYHDSVGLGDPTISEADAGMAFTLMALTLLSAWSLTVIQRRLGKHSQRNRHFLTAALILLVVTSMGLRTPDPLTPETRVVSQWARSILNGAPEDSLLLCGGSHLGSALIVIQHHEGVRPDITVLDRTGAIDPTVLGLGVDTKATKVLQTAQSLVEAGRPLVALPLALDHPLLRGRSLSPWGLMLRANAVGVAPPDDSGAWNQVDIADLPLDPLGAWQWIRGEGEIRYASGQMSAEVAAATWFAVARRNGHLRGDGPWSGVLALLGDLLLDPAGTRRWARHQPADLIGQGAPVSDPRNAGSPDPGSDAPRD